MKIPWLLRTELKGAQEWIRGDLGNLAAFVAVCRSTKFSGRGSTSRCHALGPEPFLCRDVRLLHRTTRSASATDAGQRLLSELRPAIEKIAGALENLNKERLRPMGRL
jgi:hypothetical protein